MTQASPGKTAALVVGVEAYANGEFAGIDGPVLDACKFVDWLRNAGVSAGNILLHLSPLSKNALVRPQDGTVLVGLATRDVLEKIITGTIQAMRDIDLLLVFWGGHGLGDGQGKRYLLYADARPAAAWNLNVDEFLTLLRSDRYIGIRRTIVFIDACAIFKELARLPAKLPTQELPSGLPLPSARQFALYATQEGRAAKNLDREQTGAFSRELLAELAERKFPLVMSDVAASIKRRFEVLRAAGKSNQVPTAFIPTPDDDSALAPFFKDRSSAEDVEPALVSKLYNREDQDDEFFCLLESRVQDKGGVSTWVVFGQAFEQHESLVERLVRKHVQPRARRAGAARGVCATLSTIRLKGIPDLALLQKRLRVGLASVTEADNMPTNGWDVLNAAGLARSPFVVIPHLIQVAKYSPAYPALIRWYSTEFWRPKDDAESRPNVLLFLLIDCPEAVFDRTLIHPSTWLNPTGRRLRRALPDLASDEARCAVLPELKPLEAADLINWFILHAQGLGDLVDQYSCRDAAGKLFEQARRRTILGALRTDDIEHRLLTFYSDLTAVKTYG